MVPDPLDPKALEAAARKFVERFGYALGWKTNTWEALDPDLQGVILRDLEGITARYLSSLPSPDGFQETSKDRQTLGSCPDGEGLREALEKIERIISTAPRSMLNYELHRVAREALASSPEPREGGEITDEMVERAAYPIFVGVARAPWTRRDDDERCEVKPITKNECRNLARAALQAAREADHE